MSRSRFLASLGLALIMTLTVLQWRVSPVYAADECRLIRIQGNDNYGGLRIEPEYVAVSQGACVIWMNWIRGLETMIIFEDGKTCQDVTKAPGGFALNDRSCYVTTWLDMGQTSSLMFVKPGIYRYKVETKSGQILNGTIDVQKSGYVPPATPPRTKAVTDADGDGVSDALDKCPNTIQGIKVDSTGCPVDMDQDGVPDSMDRCPRTPKGATVNEMGCWVCKDILFDFDKWEIKPEFHKALDEQVRFIRENITMPVEIQGHTDNVGEKGYNQMLSEKRAKAVMDYLIGKGIPKDRLTSKGYGESRPLASNDKPEGRAINRRVQFSACYDVMQ